MGTTARTFSSGRPRVTATANDHFIVLQVKRNRRQTVEAIAFRMEQNTRRRVSPFTMAMRPQQWRRRFLWGQERKKWAHQQWFRVLFTDESRFSMINDAGGITYRKSREYVIIPLISSKDTVVKVPEFLFGWYHAWQPYEPPRTSISSARYCAQILLPYLCLFRRAVGRDFLFMDHNALRHHTASVKELLENEDIHRMD